jgi:hypothetical protein
MPGIDRTTFSRLRLELFFFFACVFPSSFSVAPRDCPSFRSREQGWDPKHSHAWAIVVKKKAVVVTAAGGGHWCERSQVQCGRIGQATYHGGGH